MSRTTNRILLVKPGDVLLIGNAASVHEYDPQVLADALDQLKQALGLKFVGIFEDDVDIQLLPDDAR